LETEWEEKTRGGKAGRVGEGNGGKERKKEMGLRGKEKEEGQ